MGDEKMNLSKVTAEELILLDAECRNRQECVRVLAERLHAAGNLTNKEEFLEAVEERERLASTYCTMEIAIPHGITKAVREPKFAFMRLRTAIDWDGDGETPVRYLFLISMPAGEAQGEENQHIRLLSQIAVMTLDEEFQDRWKHAENAEELIELFENYR